MSIGKFAKKQEVNLATVITPMLDMAFQLLAFFILTYRPASLQEGYFAGDLLPAKEEPKSGPSKAPPLLEKKEEDLPKLEEIITVRVESVPKDVEHGLSKKRDGMPEKVEVKFPNEVKSMGDQDTTVNDTMQKLAKELNAYVAEATKAGEGGPKLKLVIDADDRLKHQYFIQIYDACKAANFDQVSFSQPPGLKKAKMGGS